MLEITNERVDDSATASLRRAKLRSKSAGDLQGAVISAGYHAKKQGRTMLVYGGNSYGFRVFRVTAKRGEALDPINNTGDHVITVSPELTVTVYDVGRERDLAGLRESLKRP